jgi:hypothetical protein
MIATISHADLRKQLDKTLTAYANSRSKGLINFAMTAGECLALVNLVQDMELLPPEEVTAYRNRLSGLGAIHCIAVSK